MMTRWGDGMGEPPPSAPHKKPCDAGFIPKGDSDPTLTCDREGLHIVHRDSSARTKFVRVPIPGKVYVIEDGD